jgi:hypothetical protein
MTTAVSDISGCVLVPIERLRKLEEAVANIPTIIAKAKEEAHAERFAKLRARDKADHESHLKRNAEWRKKHKDELNAKRREQYRLQKEKAATAKDPGV